MTSDLLKLAEQCGAYVAKRPDGTYFVQMSNWNFEKFTAALAAPPAGISPAPLAGSDTERLDWLIGQDNCVVNEGTNGFWLCWIDENDANRTEYQKGSFPTARDAIDAARAALAVVSGEGEGA